jgi:uncharacterized protein (TIGR02466 family)
LTSDSAHYKEKQSWDTQLHSLTTPDFNQNLVDEFEMINFKKLVNDCLREYLPEYRVEFILRHGHKIVHSWFTKTVRGQRAQEHNHNPADISGCYYLHTTGDDGNIIFIDRGALDNTFMYFHDNHSHAYEPKEGRIVLFPSYLTHRVSENKTDSTRISFSFDIYINKFTKD